MENRKRRGFSEPYFTLTGEDLCPIATLCIGLTSSLMKNEEMKDTVYLDNFYMKGFRQLEKELNAHNHIKPVDIMMNYEASYSLMYAIHVTFTYFEVMTQFPQKNRLIHESLSHESAQLHRNALKEKAGQLLYSIVQHMDFPVAGISYLKNTFQISIGVPRLDVDNKKQIGILKITEEMKIFIEWTVKLLGYLRYHYMFYDFSFKFRCNLFINLIDFSVIHYKFKNCKLEKNIPITLFDAILLYQCVILAAFVFESDAIGFINFKDRDAYSKLSRGKRVAKHDIAFLQGHDLFLKKHKDFLKTMKKEYSGNTVFMEHIETFSMKRLKQILSS